MKKRNVPSLTWKWEKLILTPINYWSGYGPNFKNRNNQYGTQNFTRNSLLKNLYERRLVIITREFNLRTLEWVKLWPRISCSTGNTTRDRVLVKHCSALCDLCTNNIKLQLTLDYQWTIFWYNILLICGSAKQVYKFCYK